MSASTIPKIPYLKPEAKVPLEIGSGIVARLYKLMLFLTEGKTQADMDEFKRKAESKAELTGWMAHLALVMGLLEGISLSARKMGMVEYRELNLPDNLPVPQSQSQPG